MGKCKDPNYQTGRGRRGPMWTRSLTYAADHGAVIVVEETGVPVTYYRPKKGANFRPWVDEDGNRYESRECIPLW